MELADEILRIIQRIERMGPNHCHFCQDNHVSSVECFVNKWSGRIREKLRQPWYVEHPFYVLGFIEEIESYFSANEISIGFAMIHYAYMKVFLTRQYGAYWTHFLNFLRMYCVTRKTDLVRQFYAAFSILEMVSWYNNGSPVITISINLTCEGLIQNRALPESLKLAIADMRVCFVDDIVAEVKNEEAGAEEALQTFIADTVLPAQMSDLRLGANWSSISGCSL